MGYGDLLERMMQRDTEAFLELTDRYGWMLYSEIRRKVPGKAEADRVYDETMRQFYGSLQNSACEDPIEAMLCAFADKIAETQGITYTPFIPKLAEYAIQPPAVQVPVLEEEPEKTAPKRKGRFWRRLGWFLALVGFAAVVWVGVGLMMEAGILPYYDLGYSWVSSIAANWL